VTEIEAAGVQEFGEDLGRLHQPRARPVEVLVPIGHNDASGPRCGELPPFRLLDQRGHLAGTALDVETARHDRDHIGVGLGKPLDIDVARVLPGLAERIDAVARDLSAGEHRYLEIAIALAAKPKMLLLDEPATGLNPEEAAYLMNLIRTLRSQGVTVLLVEHNMRLITNICTRITVLNFGAKIAEGTPEEIVGNPDVITAYLGKRRGA